MIIVLTVQPFLYHFDVDDNVENSSQWFSADKHNFYCFSKGGEEDGSGYMRSHVESLEGNYALLVCGAFAGNWATW